MKRIQAFILSVVLCIGVADAASRRDENTVTRQPGNTETVVNRAATSASIQSRTPRLTQTQDRVADAKTTVSRSATSRTDSAVNTARTATNETITSRSAVAGQPRVSQPKSLTTARSTISNLSLGTSSTFGTGYNACRDAYFTCMDQFCAKQDETYRRCTCSSRLEEIKSEERKLSQTGQQLQDFQSLNIDIINKTNSEVKAMLSATTGENKQEKSTDKSNSAMQLAGISAVLNKTKSQALSTQGSLDIAGDINSIWATGDLVGGADIMNLTGESLYNAVHSQCANLVIDTCGKTTTLDMVISAYGMQIENDCNSLSTALDRKTTEAHQAIRGIEYEMNIARLDNYDVHNSTEINECIAQVRKDITSKSACGTGYVHCLDITGQYLNRETGEPIYTSNFFKLETLTSLSGNVLTNQTNRLIIAELERKKESAKRGLDTCKDLEKSVWEEYKRQAITEIYQGQQSRVRQVKDECIDVVNKCYDTQNKSLKDFSNIKEQLLLGARLELSEEMCREKLDACSNIYGGGDTGLNELVSSMSNITDQKISRDCKVALEEYAEEICAVPSSDIIHAFPFSCRIYAPGEQRYASISGCNKSAYVENLGGETIKPGGDDDIDLGNINAPYMCEVIIYTKCDPGYYLYFNGRYDKGENPGNRCKACGANQSCPGDDTPPQNIETGETDGIYDCGPDYIGSLYQKIVGYAAQTCTRPSKSNDVLSTSILEDVNVVMDKIKVSMAKQLSSECERMDGLWVDTPPPDTLPLNTFFSDLFYTETSSHKKWGYCITKPSTR